MDKNWVSIKKGNHVISKIPYQAFKDVFEKDGFQLVIDSNLDDNSILSLYTDNKDQGTAKSTGGVKKKAVVKAEANKDIEKKTSEVVNNDEFSGIGKSTSRRGKK